VKPLSRRAALGAAAALVAASGIVRAQGRGAREGAPLAASADEKHALEVLADVYRNQRYLSVPEEDGRLLRILAESIGAKHVVEVGTSTGYSGLWLLLALAKTGGRLTTYELDRARYNAARENFARAGFAGIVTSVLGDAHREVVKLEDPVDLVFLDADKEGYLDYLAKLRPLVRPGGLFVAHNMASPPPDPAYVRAITTDPALETVFLNMHEAGIGVTLKKRRECGSSR
jgi:predicted O-methyltransferase YrrM